MDSPDSPDKTVNPVNLDKTASLDNPAQPVRWASLDHPDRPARTVMLDLLEIVNFKNEC